MKFRILIVVLAIWTSTLQSQQVLSPADSVKFREYSEIIDQIPFIDTNGFFLEEKILKYSDFLKTLDAVDCTKDVIATIRGYEIVSLTIGDIKTKPVFFLYNQHGNEFRAVHVLRELAKFLTTSQDVRVQYLRDNIAFYIIPTIAGWNYDNNQYLLPNGVNLNRTWDRNWLYSTDPTKGTEGPWSEPEVVVARDKILELRPFLLIDTHSSTKPGLNITAPGWKPLLMAVHNSVQNIPESPTQYWTGYNVPSGTGWGQLQTARDGGLILATTLEIDQANNTRSINYAINILHRLFYLTSQLRLGLATSVQDNINKSTTAYLSHSKELKVSSKEKIKKLTVFSLTGQTIYFGNFNTNSIEVNLSLFLDDIYLLRIITDRGVVTTKVMWNLN